MIKRRLRSIFNEAVKQNSINLKNSYLVVSHVAMLNNDFKDIKETIFQDLNKILK